MTLNYLHLVPREDKIAFTLRSRWDVTCLVGTRKTGWTLLLDEKEGIRRLPPDPLLPAHKHTGSREIFTETI